MNFSDLNPIECNEPKCRHGVNGGNRGGCSECPGGINSEEKAEVVMWVDDARCEETFHQFVRRDGKWIVLHGDDEECLLCEFDVSDLAA